MARPREFDPDEVLEIALNIFWTQGYEATSMDYLASEMKLKKGSIYRCFGNKESLFLKALSRYLDKGYRNFQEILDGSDSARTQLQNLLSVIVDMSDCGSKPKGCFATNSLVELSPHAEAIAKLLNQQRERLESLYADTVARGQREGQFRSDLDPKLGGQFVYTLIAGLMADSKHLQGRERTQRLTEAVLSLLEAPMS